MLPHDIEKALFHFKFFFLKKNIAHAWYEFKIKSV